MKLFETRNYKKAKRELIKINELEPIFEKLSDIQLKAKTDEFKTKLAAEDVELDDIRIEAFALVREAAKRVLKKRLYDVQILGGLILDYGNVAEMKTGEGKTITSIAPVYLNALSGKGVIVSTVNEYLTERDAEEMGKVHEFLGLTIGVNKRELTSDQKRQAYACDITYSIHSEIGFDYLRDNMVSRFEEKVQRGFNFCLIDEVDSILIDEARTPLIITGGGETSSTVYQAANAFITTLKNEDIEIDLESKTTQLLDSGIQKANSFFGVKNIFEIQNSELVHRIQNALRAHKIMNKDIDYIVSSEGEILIVDAFTGRILEGRTFSEGMHQAIQAKENVKIEPETKTLATITYQNLFRMFTKLSGMTGTAKTEEDEFMEIYNMRVIEIPTNKPIIREDFPDHVFVSSTARLKALVNEVKERNKRGQPILVGTEELSQSEIISKKLSEEGIKHTVLNAKQNQREAETISEAGIKGAVTIATNMAGRGTDIKPTPESLKLGGLFVLGTSKAESRRIDNQLKGRAGRQGDIGQSRFFLSLDDSLLSRFSNQQKLKKAFESFGDNPIKGKLIVRSLQNAQKRIEGLNHDSRKNLLQYDDVIRQQRDLMYSQRDIIIREHDLHVVISRMLSSVVRDLLTDKNFETIRNNDNTINEEKITHTLNNVWFSLTNRKLIKDELVGKTNQEMIEIINNHLQEAYSEIRSKIIENSSEDYMHSIEREIVLRTFDENWTLHIDKMTKLKASSSMASYAQKNPYQVFVEEGATLFQETLKRISHNTAKLIMNNRYAIPQQPSLEDEFLRKEVEIILEKNLDKKPKTEKKKTKAPSKTTTKKASSKNITTKKASKPKSKPKDKK